MTRRILTALTASMLLAAAIPASAQDRQAFDIAFSSDSASPARRIVDVVFESYLRERTGVQVETATVDLNGDGIGEIAARFVHTGSCREGMTLCRTVLLRHDKGNWTIALDRYASRLTFYPHTLVTPGNVATDGVEWSWGARRYVPLDTSFGPTLPMKSVPSGSMASFAAAFGEGAAKLVSGGYGVGIEYSDVKLAADRETIIMKMTGDIVCGDETGCPVRVLRKDGETWSTLLASSTTNHLSVLEVTRGGYQDLALQTKDGYVIMGWDGNAYALADRIEAVARAGR